MCTVPLFSSPTANLQSLKSLAGETVQSWAVKSEEPPGHILWVPSDCPDWSFLSEMVKYKPSLSTLLGLQVSRDYCPRQGLPAWEGTQEVTTESMVSNKSAISGPSEVPSSRRKGVGRQSQHSAHLYSDNRAAGLQL